MLRRALSATQYHLLSRLIDGEPLGRAIASIAEMPDIDWQSAERDLRSWFAEWMADRFFIELRRLIESADLTRDLPSILRSFGGFHHALDRAHISSKKIFLLVKFFWE